jgi:hypothetical protein
MAGVKITNFLGIAPKIASELLPDTAAQVARNLKLDSGNLIPYPRPVKVGSTERSEPIRTLYGLQNPVDDSVTWLSWPADVNIAVATTNENREQRFYYTGDEYPKVSDYAMATEGGAPYPAAYTGFRALGVELPTGNIIAPVVSSFVTKTVQSYARDAGNTVTIVTTAAHGLRTGNSVTVSGFTSVSGTYSQTGTTITVTMTDHGLSTGASVFLDFTSGNAIDGTFTATVNSSSQFTVTAGATASTSGNVNLDLRGFNATSVECTVINATTFTYFSPGFPLTTRTASAEKVDLAGLTQNRTYVWTWYTAWKEESVASEPSADLFIRDGQIVTLTNLPTLVVDDPLIPSPPLAQVGYDGIRVYRSVPSTSGTEYFRLVTLWNPVDIKAVERTDDVSRVTLPRPHNLGIDDKFRIRLADTFDISDGVVTDLVDDYTFEFAQVGPDIPYTLGGDLGKLYFAIAYSGANAPYYWGAPRGTGGTTTPQDWQLVDDFDSRLLEDALESDTYDPPPRSLKGLVAIQNNVLAGFVANEVYFSEPNLPHAWPIAYKITLEHEIVGLAAVSGALLVLTESYPYIISGSDPAAGYSTQRIDLRYPCVSAKSIVNMMGGVLWASHDGLVFYSSLGTAVLTKFNYSNDTWNTDLDPSTIVATSYGDVYLASHSTGAFTFERDERAGGLFVTLDQIFSATWYDSRTNKVYYTTDSNEDIYEWDNLTQPLLTQQWKSKTFKTKDVLNMGAARVIADYGPPPPNPAITLWEATATNWENTTATFDSEYQLFFKLYVDKTLAFTRGLNDSKMFRLPNGYRSDSFEFEVEAAIRIRELQVAETALGLEGL